MPSLTCNLNKRFSAIAAVGILLYGFCAIVTAADVSVSWNANTEPDLAGYKLYYGSSSRSYDKSITVGNKTSYTVTGLSAGKYYFSVTAYDTSSNESSFSDEQSITITSGTGTTYGSDDYSRTVSNGWGSAEVGGAYTISGGTTSNFSVNGSAGVIVLDTLGERKARLTGVSRRDLTVTARVTTNKLAAGGYQKPSVLLRRVDGNNYYRFEVGFTPSRGVQATIISKLAGSVITLGTVSTGLTHATGRYFWVKAQAEGINPTTLRMKVWQRGTAEPTVWNLAVTDSATTLQVSAPIALFSSVSSATTNLPVTFSWDDLLVTDISP